MILVFPSPLQFPSQEAIATYLENHSLTNGSDFPYLKKTESHLNKKIIKVVSEALADLILTSGSVRVWVELAIDPPEKEIPLSNESRVWVVKNLTFALQQCAREAAKMRFERK